MELFNPHNPKLFLPQPSLDSWRCINLKSRVVSTWKVYFCGIPKIMISLLKLNLSGSSQWAVGDVDLGMVLIKGGN